MSENIGPLAEHMNGTPAPKENQGYNPDEEEKKVIRLVERLYKKAKKAKKKVSEKWGDFYKMYRGKQWKEQRPSYRHSEVINLVFQTIESMVPVLTDSRPKLEYMSTVKDNPELTDILNKVAENDWEHNNWLSILTDIIKDGHFYGTGIGYCGFDPKANMGLGNILFESSDPFNAYPDPSGRDFNDKRMKYHVDAEPVDLGQLKKEYPDKAQFLQADAIDLSGGDTLDATQTFFKSPVDSRLYVEDTSQNDSSVKSQALKITLYYLDDEICEEEIVPDGEAMGGEGERIQKLKYPNGRKIVIAGGVLLEDGPLEFDDGKIPFVKYVNYAVPREFWGISEVEQLEGPQKTFNKMISFALDYMTLMGNPVWVVGTTANIDTDNLINKPGLIIETDDVNAVRREAGVPLPNFIMELADRFKQYIDGISGQTDLSRGATSAQVSAASAITSLQEAQQTRLRLKSRNIDALLRSFGRMYMSRVLQYYSVPRIVRVTGDENVEKYFHFHVETLEGVNAEGKPEQKKIAHVTAGTDAMGMPITKQYEIMGDFDVRVSTGSSLPFAKDQKSGVSMNLFKLGVIDDEELLKNSDYPNYEEVLRRVEAKKQMKMQQEMRMQQQQAAQAQAAKGAPQGPPPGAPPQGQ